MATNKCILFLFFLLYLQRVSLISLDQLIHIFRQKITNSEQAMDAFANHDFTSEDEFVDILQYFDNSRKSVPEGYCRTFRTCSECTKSAWYPCGWCHELGCVDNAEKDCPFPVTRDDPHANVENETFCPYIEHQGPILIPAKVRQNIKVKLHTSDPGLYGRELKCLLQFNDRETHLKAVILNGVVYCYPVKLNNPEHGEKKIGTLQIAWGGAASHSNQIPVTVYRCDSLAIDCEGCRQIPTEYGCGWCPRRRKCVTADNCPNLVKWNLNRITCKSFDKKSTVRKPESL